MKLIRTATAQQGYYEVVDYIVNNFGLTALKNFRTELKQCEQRIKENPESGAVEWSLSDNNITCRYFLVNRLSKVLYIVRNNAIYEVDFYDARREPPKEIINPD